MHYLDNSATTIVRREAAEKAVSFMTDNFGNPSSLHRLGYDAKCGLEAARDILAKSLGAQSSEIYFTSGGTESDNMAILGAAAAGRRRGNKIVTTAVEHSAVLSAMKELEARGFEVVYLQPDLYGNITEGQIAEAIDQHTILVSIMLVNNEVGNIYPVQAAAAAIRRSKAPALLHSDAVQGYMKLPFTVRKLGVDLLTVSGHKVHAPKGTGLLYVKKGVHIPPLQFGGGQESGLRSGTEALPLAAAFAEAVRLAENPIELRPKIAALKDSLLQGLSAFPEIDINSDPDCLPYILNFSAGKVRAETMLHFLSDRAIYVSSGSACGKAKPSHVLTAMGLSPERIRSSLRVSFSHLNSEEDVDALLKALRQGLDSLATER